MPDILLIALVAVIAALAVLGSSLFAMVFFGGFVLLALRVVWGQSFWLTLSFLAVIFALGAAKGFIRWRAVGILLALRQVRHRAADRRGCRRGRW